MFIRQHHLFETYSHAETNQHGVFLTPDNHQEGKYPGTAMGSRKDLPYDKNKEMLEIKRNQHDPEKNVMLKAAKEYSQKHLGKDLEVNVTQFAPSSLRRQYAIAQAGKLAQAGNPEYERAVFQDYKENHPEVVGHATDYKGLVDNAYKAAAKETMDQFHHLPVKIQFHPGYLNYHDSSELLRDMHLHHHLTTFQGGDPHEHLHEVDPKLGVSHNDIFRAVHDAYGHGISGATFGRQGEEHAYQIHQKMYSPLARIAVAGETRQQNSWVHFTDANLDNMNKMESLRAKVNHHIENGDKEAANQASKELREVGSGWNYAKQKSVALPSVMNEPKYNGEAPDYLKHLLKDPESQKNPNYDVDKDHLHLVKLAKLYNTTTHLSPNAEQRGKMNTEQATDDVYHMAKMHGFTGLSKYPF